MQFTRGSESNGARSRTGVETLDELDLGIIDSLRLDPTVTSAHLASKFDVTNATAGARIQRLKTQGIARVIAATPLPSAGFGVVALVRIQVESQALVAIDDLGRRLASMHEVIAAGATVTEEQLEMVYAAPRLSVMEQFIEKQLGAIRGLARVQVGFMSIVYKERADIGMRSPVNTTPSERFRSLKRTPLVEMLTDVELQLLSELQVDGRLGKRELSRRLGISEPKIRSRLSSLTDRGMLEHVLVVHPRALGKRRLAGVDVDVDHRRVSSVADALRSMEEVSLVVVTFGRDYRLWINVHAPSNGALERFLNSSLAMLEGVRGYRVVSFAQGYKHDPWWRLGASTARNA